MERKGKTQRREWSAEEKIIKKAVKTTQQRLFYNNLLRKLISGLTIALILSLLLQILLFWIPIPYIWIWNGGVCLACLLFAFFIACIGYPDQKAAALILDQTGLSERIITAYERLGKKDTYSKLQREDAVLALKNYPISKKLPIKIKKRQLIVQMILLLLIVIFAGLPSAAKKQAKEKEELHAMVKEIGKEWKEKENNSKLSSQIEQLTPEQKKELESMIKQAKKELKQADTKKEVEKAKQRLEKKVKQKLEQIQEQKKQELAKAALSLQDQLQQMKQEWKKKENKQMKQEIQERLQKIANQEWDKRMQTANEMGIEGKEQLKELIEELQKQAQNKEISQKDIEKLYSLAKTVSENMENLTQMASKSILSDSLGNDSNNQNQTNQENAENSQAGSKNEVSEENKESTGQTGTGSSENGQGNKEESGEPQGQSQTGLSGQGNGNKEGTGTGWDKGKNTGMELTPSITSEPEQVAVKGKVKKDESLKGKVNAEGNSSTASSENGFAWSGNSVDYNQVIGEYTQKAYERIRNNKIPSGMEDVVKSYFEGLNQ